MKAPVSFFRPCSIAIAFLFLLLIPAKAQTWNAALDIITNEKPDQPDPNSTELSNPNARVPQWSYGYRATLTGTDLVLFATPPDEHTNAGIGNDAIEGWDMPGGFWPLVYCNVSGAPVRPSPELRFLAPDALDVHPGNGFSFDTFAVVRWTAPVIGNYEVRVHWRDLDPNGGDGVGAHMVLNGKSIYDANVPNGGETSDFRVLTLSAGDLVDFVVDPGPKGDQAQDSTALKIIVRFIPCVTE